MFSPDADMKQTDGHNRLKLQVGRGDSNTTLLVDRRQRARTRAIVFPIHNLKLQPSNKMFNGIAINPLFLNLRIQINPK